MTFLVKIKAYHNPVSDHLVCQSTKITVFGERMQCCDECVNYLAFFLAALIELCPLENNFTENHEVLIKLRFNGVVMLRQVVVVLN